MALSLAATPVFLLGKIETVCEFLAAYPLHSGAVVRAGKTGARVRIAMQALSRAPPVETGYSVDNQVELGVEVFVEVLVKANHFDLIRRDGVIASAYVIRANRDCHRLFASRRRVKTVVDLEAEIQDVVSLARLIKTKAAGWRRCGRARES